MSYCMCMFAAVHCKDAGLVTSTQHCEPSLLIAGVRV